MCAVMVAAAAVFPENVYFYELNFHPKLPASTIINNNNNVPILYHYCYEIVILLL